MPRSALGFRMGSPDAYVLTAVSTTPQSRIHQLTPLGWQETCQLAPATAAREASEPA